MRVEDPDLCPRFVARVMTGLSVGDSPTWLARRLTLAGMRPINNVVDASNYVMLELGQPTHPYDLDRLDGGGLVVRRAKSGRAGSPPWTGPSGSSDVPPGAREAIPVTASSATPAASRWASPAIMGGASSEIAPTTTRVLLEVAYFAPMAIARTSKRLGLRTEASARFERGCDPAGLDRAADRFVELLSLSGGAWAAGGQRDHRRPGRGARPTLPRHPSRVG